MPPLVQAGQFLCSGDQGRDPSEKELCSAVQPHQLGWSREEQLLLWVVREQEQAVRDSCTALEMVLLECVLFSTAAGIPSALPCEGNGSLMSHSLIPKGMFTL